MSPSAFLMLIAGLCLSQSAWAQYPNKPIKLVVPIAPGGTPDITARLIGSKIAERLGQPVVIENKAGSNGNIAGEAVARSAHDGYTLLFGMESMFVINPHLYAKIGFDPLKDLVPVATTTVGQLVLTVNPSLPVKTFKEFIDYARAAKPPLNYASGGNGSQHHLTMELLKQRAGINLVHIPYKSGTPAVAAVVAGDVPVIMSGTSSLPQMKSGRLLALAVTGRHRLASFPEVPTLGEFYPGLEVNTWMGIWAPAGTPDAVLARLRDEINRVLALPEMKERLDSATHSEPWISSPEEFAATIRRDDQKYRDAVKGIGATVD